MLLIFTDASWPQCGDMQTMNHIVESCLLTNQSVKMHLYSAICHKRISSVFRALIDTAYSERKHFAYSSPKCTSDSLMETSFGWWSRNFVSAKRRSEGNGEVKWTITPGMTVSMLAVGYHEHSNSAQQLHTASQSELVMGHFSKPNPTHNFWTQPNP